VNQKQSDQTEGFIELLEMGGSTLSWNGVEFSALITKLEPKEERYDLTPGDDSAVGVRTLLSSFNPTLPCVGSYFNDQDGTLYRVIRLIRIPNDLTLTFECEVTFP
jgi:hypothetical protein